MPTNSDDKSGQRTFNSVQEFWDAQGLDGQTAEVKQGSFEGLLRKGVVDGGQVRELRRDDIDLGGGPDTLIVVQVENTDRRWNWERCQNPPPRTGLFEAFMDEVEEVAARAGCRHVWVEKVGNEFLPEKLENRGYNKVDNPNWVPNPDYMKFLP